MTDLPPLEPPMPVTPAPRWMKPLLVASLCLNLAVAGIVGGTLLYGPPEGPRAVGRDLGFGPFTEALSPADRQALARAFLGRGGSPRDMRRDLRSEFGNLQAALRADPFDADAFRTVFDRMKDRGQERLALGQQLLSDRIVAMTSEERLRFADRLKDRLSHRPPRGAAGTGTE